MAERAIEDQELRAVMKEEEAEAAKEDAAHAAARAEDARYRWGRSSAPTA